MPFPTLEEGTCSFSFQEHHSWSCYCLPPLGFTTSFRPCFSFTFSLSSCAQKYGQGPKISLLWLCYSSRPLLISFPLTAKLRLQKSAFASCLHIHCLTPLTWLPPLPLVRPPSGRSSGDSYPASWMRFSQTSFILFSLWEFHMLKLSPMASVWCHILLVLLFFWELPFHSSTN